MEVGRILRGGLSGLTLLACWVVAPTILAPTAAANEPSTPVASTFEIEASHGYTLSIVAGPSLSHPDQGQVAVGLRRGGSSAEYLAPASVTPTSIDVDLGSLGRIAVNFVPSGSTTQRSICAVSHAFESGTYEGEIEFHGERGYSDIDATSADGLVGPLTNFFCAAGGPGETWGPKTPGARLRVGTRKLRHGFILEVNKNYPRARVPFYAVTEERQGAISVVRAVEGSAGPGAFTFDPRLQMATVALPAPFTGRAQFSRAATHGRRWSGSLRVDFPGLPQKRLTGMGAKAELVHREIFR